jgi:hypothetical protein
VLAACSCDVAQEEAGLGLRAKDVGSTVDGEGRDVQDLERVTSYDETWLAPRASPDVHTG